MRVPIIFSSSVLLFTLTIMQSNAQTATTSAEQAYPVRPVRMILASGPGSAPDVIGRLLANKLSESWSLPVIVDNRPGATGLIAVELLAQSAPDGQTLGLFTMTNLIAMLMYQKYMLATELGAVTLVAIPEIALAIANRYGSETITTNLPGLLVSALLILVVLFVPNGPVEQLHAKRAKRGHSSHSPVEISVRVGSKNWSTKK